jgi:glycosyltransferase involved in cell wall biosynthesis
VPVLSIVVPAYNEEAFIGKTLHTILEVDVEKAGFTKKIIVVNDGSKDGTEAIVRQFSQVRLINQIPNQRRGAALKRGIAEATGAYILFQDADVEALVTCGASFIGSHLVEGLGGGDAVEALVRKTEADKGPQGNQSVVRFDLLALCNGARLVGDRHFDNPVAAPN